jgi:hypothetical protein
MDVMHLTSTGTGAHGRRPLAASACGLTLTLTLLLLLACAGGAHGQSAAQTPGAGSAPLDSATLVQCLTASEPAERSATFSGEMTTIPGAVRMSMRIELLERTPGETGYHPVLAPGVGMWRTADPGVKSYKHLEQVTNLSAPAYYRALISFRWEGPHWRILKRDEQRSPRCVQSAPAPPSPASPLE